MGITGGICTGKSEVTKTCQDSGYSIVYADKLGHQAYHIGTNIYHEIIKHFSENILLDNHEINRSALGDIVFSDKTKLKKLQQIVWPYIKTEIKRKITLHEEKKERVLILEAAVLIEAGWDRYTDEIWVVQCSKELQMERLTKERGLSTDAALKRISAQDLSQINKTGSYKVIENSEDLSKLRDRTIELINGIENKLNESFN